jgi:broad specificity phosphatase PhoE
MPVRLVFETHSLSVDNELGLASGWLPGRLSERGRELARELDQRRAHDGLAAVFTSDLRRALETVEIAFAGSRFPVFIDWRLRECDYGSLNGAPAAQVHAERRRRLRSPYPGGESWEQAVCRVGRFLGALPTRWSGDRVLLIGHVATRWALDHLLGGAELEELIDAEFAWGPGWEHDLNDPQPGQPGNLHGVVLRVVRQRV